MIQAKLAKKVMEKAEGLNHIQIRIRPSIEGLATDVRIRLSLPQGLYRTVNLNRYPEESDGTIVADGLDVNADVLIALITQEAVAVEQGSIVVWLTYTVNHLHKQTEYFTIPISFVDCAEDVEHADLVTDDEVAERALQLSGPDNERKREDFEFIVIPPIRHNYHNEYADIGKKYRIDCM